MSVQYCGTLPCVLLNSNKYYKLTQSFIYIMSNISCVHDICADPELFDLAF